MLWPADSINEVYENIRDKALTGGCTVLVLVALDCDALCACRILTDLFKSDHVAYKVKSVSGYDDIRTAYEQLVAGNTEIKSVVMINCGGSVDLRKAYPLEEDAYCYVMDSHRPYSHYNILPSSEQVIVLGDDFLNLQAGEVPDESDEEHIQSDSDDSESDADEDDDNSENGRNSENDNDDGDEEGEEEFSMGGDDEESSAKRARLSDDAVSVSSHQSNSSSRHGDRSTSNRNIGESGNRGSDDDDDDNEHAHNSENVGDMNNNNNAGKTNASRKSDNKFSKRSKAGSAKQLRSQEQLVRRQRWSNYYHGTFVGQPAAHTAYQLALQLNKECVPLVWLAIVGTTFHYLEEQLPQEKYEQVVDVYREQVKDLCTDYSNHEAEAEDGTHIPSAEGARITFSEEYKLMLHRHWPLYDAFYHSSYVASRLGIWRQDGRAKLELFFAKLGVSLKECRQKFNFMSVHLKRRLGQKITKHGQQFGLQDMTYESFQYQLGFNTQLNAADMVYSVTALLEGKPHGGADAEAVLDSLNGGGGGGGGKDGSMGDAAIAAGASQTNTATQSSQAMTEADAAEIENASNNSNNSNEWEERFNTAYDSLVSRRSVQLTAEGLALSMELQRAVVNQGVSIMEAKLIQSAGDFRYLVLEHLSDHFERIFLKPQGLRKLALFLVQAHRDCGKWQGAAARPFVLGVVDSRKGTVLLVGMQCRSDGRVGRNTFGRHFRNAANAIDARFRHDGFDSSFIEVENDDVQRFLIALNEAMAM